MRVFLQTSLAALCAGMLFALCIATGSAAPSPASPADTAAGTSPQAPPPTGAAAPPRTRVLTLSQMGTYGPMALRGVSSTGTLNVGVRTDEVVTSAKLKLDMAWSPALIFPLSHIKVLLNGVNVATLPLDKEDAGKQVTRTLDLDPLLFTDFNQITLQMVAHYTTDSCEDPYHSSLWTDVIPATTLTLTTSGVALPDNLALLPRPFFDRRDDRLLTLPFVLPTNAPLATLQTAGVVASWFGNLADYRHARFSVLNALPPDSHAIVLAMPGAMPPGLTLPEIRGPTVMVMANPASPAQSGRKLLVLAGRDGKELQSAANALVLDHASMTGNSVLIRSIDLGPGRRPYDAPKWAPVDRPILFRDLVDDPQQLEVSGFNPPQIRVNLRVPPDLYAWARQSAPMDVHYRYTAPSTFNDSMLNTSINEQLLLSERLRPSHAGSEDMRLNIPLLTNTETGSSDEVSVPPFRVADNNTLQFQFHMDPQKTGLCASTATNVARAAIDPNSTIDFSGFVHFTAMPNLSYFTMSGFPFTRMADLSDTAVVVPDAPTADDEAAALTLLGDMGAWTGLPALRVELVAAKDVDSARNRDLLVIGTGSAGDLLAKWGKALPLVVSQGSAALRLREQRREAWNNWPTGRHRPLQTPVGEAVISTSGPLAALIGFESPLAAGRSVVAIAATSPAQLGDALAVLQDDRRPSPVYGDLTLIRGTQVDSLELGGRYFVGEVPWYARLWIFVSNYPSLLAIAGILGGLIVSLAVFWALSRLAVRRTGGG
ncbi:cellulose synthase subunit B [Burkholderia sp. H160]|nr:cellulose synthase subunit B [Burkholderia sp. H160]